MKIKELSPEIFYLKVNYFGATLQFKYFLKLKNIDFKIYYNSYLYNKHISFIIFTTLI
jgi:hypothetical protein